MKNLWKYLHFALDILLILGCVLTILIGDGSFDDYFLAGGLIAMLIYEHRRSTSGK